MISIASKDSFLAMDIITRQYISLMRVNGAKYGKNKFVLGQASNFIPNGAYFKFWYQKYIKVVVIKLVVILFIKKCQFMIVFSYKGVSVFVNMI